MRVRAAGKAAGVVLCLTSLLGAQTRPPQRMAADPARVLRAAHERPRFHPQRLLVKFRPGLPAQTMDSLARGQGALEVRPFRLARPRGRAASSAAAAAAENAVDRWRRVTLRPGTDMRGAMAGFRLDSSVESVEPDYERSIAATPNDPDFSKLWGLHNTGQTGGTSNADIDAPEAWDTQTDGSSAVVGVIDTGVAYNHPDLAANMWVNPGEIPGNGLDDDWNGYVDDVHGADFINNDGDPMDDHSHGTHVAGTIAAVGNNGIGVAGVNWKARIMALKFLGAGGSGSTSDAVEAVLYASAMGARVTNNSWGGGGFSQALLDAIKTAELRGCLFVAAAGNSASDNDVYASYPSTYEADNIISVAATDHNDQIAYFSSYGARTVDLGAPGVAIYSTVPPFADPSGYDTFSGTSMATPHVAGAAALIFGTIPGLTIQQVKARLLGAAVPIPALQGKTVTGGRLNVFGSMEADAVAPSAVGDLAVTEAKLRSAILSWTATGDDGMSGTARRYDLRYSKTPITVDNFAAATIAAGVPSPQSTGTTETFTVKGLEPATTYYFALKVSDNVGNTSPLSNSPSATTLTPTTYFTDNMESGSGKWTMLGSSGTGPSLWHISSRRATSPTQSFYYGQESTGTYETNYRNWGAISSIPVDLRCGEEATVTFKNFLKTENWPTYFDQATLWATKDGGETWTKIRQLSDTVGTAFTTETTALTGYERNRIQVRLLFDTVDEDYNWYEGWYVDDVKIEALAVTSGAPVARTAGRYLGVVNQPLVFDGSDSIDCAGGAVTYAWDFGDGSVGSGSMPTHTYTAPGTYAVTMTVTSAGGSRTVNTKAVVGVPVAWTNLVGVAATGNSLTRGPEAAAWNAGAASVQQIPSGDAGVEMTVTETDTFRLLGLSNGDGDQNFNDVDFAIYPASDGNVYVLESGVSRGMFGAYQTGDRLAVEVQAGSIRYLRNGKPLYTKVPSNLRYPLRVDSSLYSPGATLTNVIAYGNLADNLAPVPYAGGTYRWSTGQSIRFDGSRSSDPDGTVASYSWDFGDGGTATGATPTHTYSSPGAYTVTLTVTDNLGLSASITTTADITGAATSAVTWTNAVGVNASAGQLQKTAADGWNSGAVSSKTILSGDGFVETTVVETNTYRLIGLSNGDSGQSYTDVDFAIYPSADGKLYIFEKGANRGPMGPYVTGDRLRVSVDGAVVRYIQNGRVIGTSVQAPVYPLLVDTSLYSTGATLSGVVAAGIANAPPVARPGGPYEWSAGSPILFDGSLSSDPDGSLTSYTWDFGDGTPTGSGATPSHTYAGPGTYTVTLIVTDNDGATHSATVSAVVNGFVGTTPTWTNPVGVSTVGSTISKTAATSAWDAGASSAETIASGDGFVSATVDNTTTYRMIGLGTVDSNPNYTDVDFAIYPAADGLIHIFEAGTYRGAFGSYAAGDQLRVSVRAGVVRYIRNGKVLHASAVSPVYPLAVDSSFYTPGASFTNVMIARP